MTENHFQPFIPTAKVERAIVGKVDDVILNFIKSFGIDLIRSDENSDLDEPIRNHADVNIIHADNEIFFADRGQSVFINNRFPNSQVVETTVESPYPNDCRLNVAVIGEFVFARMSSLDEKLHSYFEEKNYRLVNVKQGYTKCSSCIIDEKNLITDDLSIFNAAKSHSINTLLVEKGDIRLAGYNYGFIGGASAMIDKRHLIFFGDITKHKSFAEINEFLCSANCNYDYIKNYPLTDIGGLVII